MGETNPGSVVLSTITEFCSEFRAAIDGNTNDLSQNELSGGARISFVFHELFNNGVRSIDPLDQNKDGDIRTILYNSSGSTPSLFVGTTAFEVIVKQQIRRLEEPALRCSSLVYDELIRILGQLLAKNVSVPTLDALTPVHLQTISRAERAVQSRRHQLLQELYEPNQQARLRYGCYAGLLRQHYTSRLPEWPQGDGDRFRPDERQ